MDAMPAAVFAEKLLEELPTRRLPEITNLN